MMRTRRKGHAVELLCETCDQHYAEVFPDRFVVYSSHFGKSHTSGLGLEEMQKVYEVAQSGNYLRLECTCNQLACAVVQLNRLTITTKHKAQTWQTHSNALTLEDIAEICRMIDASDAILPGELNASNLSAA
jgi:hypothetical protein